MESVFLNLRKFLLFVLCISNLLLIVACRGYEYDDAALVGRVGDLENRVEGLERLCKQMNTNISSLQVLITALQNNDYITGIIPVKQGDEILGYTVSFAKNESITIFNGKDGVNGSDGADGNAGKDGLTPLIGVKQDIDGVYYWRLNGEWLTDETGNKIQARGANGMDGTDGESGVDGVNGKDAITPILKIENNYWYVSYDNENSWKQLGKATGENGDNMFEDIKVDKDNVLFVLNDGTIFRIPLYSLSWFSVEVKKGGTLGDMLTYEQKREIVSLKIIGELNKIDIRTINFQMRNLEELDLSNVLWNVGENGMLNLNPYGGNVSNKTIREVVLPDECQKKLSVEISGWVSLEKVVISSDSIMLNADGYSLDSLIYSKKTTMIYNSDCSNFINLVLPSTMKDIFYDTFLWAQYVSGAVKYWKYSKINSVICNSIVPPRLGEWCYIYDSMDQQSTYMFKERTDVWTSAEEKKKLSECTLLVPLKSLELYKQANGWKEFGNIKSID